VRPRTWSLRQPPDVDIFVTPPSAPAGWLLSRVRLYGYLEALGGTVPHSELERHGLTPKRKQFERKYFEGNDRQTGNATEQMV